VIIRCWISGFDKIQLSGSKKQEHYIHLQMDPLDNLLTTCPFRWVVNFHWTILKLTNSGLLVTWNINFRTFKFRPRPRPDPMVLNHCWHYYSYTMWCRINWSLVEYVAGSSDFWQNEGLISHSGITLCGDSLHLQSMQATQAWIK